MIPWENIALEEIDGESPLTASLVGKFFDRDEALISQPIDTRFDEASVTDSAYSEIRRVRLWLPAYVDTDGGPVVLVIVLEVRVGTDGLSGQVRSKLGAGGTPVESATFSSDAYARITLEISAADVAAAADSEVDLILEGRYTAASTAVFARCRDAASRIERREA